MDQYIGLDVSKKRTQVVVLSSQGTKLRSLAVRNTPPDFAAFFASLPAGSRTAVLEACRDAAVVHDLVVPYVAQVQLAHPLKTRAIASARIKTDALDAATLAHLLRADLIPAAHLRAPDVRQRQQLLRQYTFFVAARTRLKQRIHSLIDRQAWEVRHQALGFRNLFSRAGRHWLQQIELPFPERRLLQAMLHGLRHLDAQVRGHARWIAELGHQDPAIGLLRSLPGVGPIWGAVLAVEIDGAQRFPSRAHLASYAGLVPSTHASGPVVRHGPITKQGNRWLRTALVEAAWSAVRYDPWFRTRYRQLAARKGPKPAITAMARKLAELCWVLLTEQRPYQPRSSVSAPTNATSTGPVAAALA